MFSELDYSESEDFYDEMTPWDPPANYQLHHLPTTSHSQPYSAQPRQHYFPGAFNYYSFISWDLTRIEPLFMNQKLFNLDLKYLDMNT